jgi:hypothetical protein
MAHGFTQAEAEKLEAVALGCDDAVAEAEVTGDGELVQLMIESGQAMINAVVAQLFIDRWFAKHKASTN